MRKWLRHYYNHSKFRTKLFMIFILSSIVPISLILMISSYFNARNMTDKVDELIISNLVQIGERVNLNLEVYTNLVYQIYQDEEIIENINLLNEEQAAGYAVAYNRINSRLKHYNSVESGVRCISVICTGGAAVVSDFETSSSVNNLWNHYQDLRVAPPYLAAADEPGMVITPTMTFREKGRRQQYFHISKRVFDLNNLEKGSIATIVMTVEERVLHGICNPDSAAEQEAGINFIMAPDDTVITFPDADFSGIKKSKELSVAGYVELSGLLKYRHTAVNEYLDPITGWRFYNVYDRDHMLADVVKAQKLYMLIGLLAILSASALMLLLVRQINRSVSSVVAGIKEVQGGNLDVLVPVVQKDEIGEIAENFNEMTVRVRELVKQVREATSQQKNAEIRALEAQINPHFLYNTLDSINWMAIDKGEYKISKMLRNLGVILRYSVDKSNALATVEEMADWLDKYISLHQLRFDGLFEYRILVAKEAGSKRIHKLLIQPFIENAILHGFRDLEGGGLLCVDLSLSEDEEMIHIIIEDNGRGMKKEQAGRFNDREEALRDDGRSIGLHNAFSRMRMYYGDRAGWNISSIEGMGTVITIRLPAL